MSEQLPISTLLNAATNHATLLNHELYKRWAKFAWRFAGTYGTENPILRQTDLHMDLVLRALEAEAIIRVRTDHSLLHADEWQITLSEYWVRSIYDAVRIAQKTEVGRQAPKLVALRRRVEMIRVQVAKLRIAQDQKLKDPVTLVKLGGGNPDPQVYDEATLFHAAKGLCEQSGSVMWAVVDVKDLSGPKWVSRRQISDELLTLFD